MRSKPFRIAALILGIASLLVTTLSGPATAEPRHLLVTLLGGKQVSITVDAAPGTPVGSISLPDLGGPVVGVTEIGSPPPAPAPATTAVPTTATTVTGAPTTIAPTTATTPPATSTQPDAVGGIVKPKGQPKGEALPDAAAVAPKTTSDASQPALEDANGTTTPTTPAEGAAPTPASPGFTIAPSGPAPIGVPNFFIDNFRIPPFLLPIYQAAGIQYSVPWQVLAAINEIETDYGRNLSVSSAGALGWMQFMPSSWAMYGVDANGDGAKDPYNPVDAIFAAARYLKAAGAETDLPRAIFAYNHADWYVESVLLRARVIGGMPADLVGSLTGLTQGHFPVAARAAYADGLDAKAATRRVHGTNAAVPVEGDPSRRSINIFARAGAPVIAVNDGRIVRLGANKRLGRFVVLEDVYGNRYMYSHLGRLAHKYPVPKPHRNAASATAPELELPKADARPTAPATAGRQPTASRQDANADSGKERITANAPRAGAGDADAPAATKERLFAHPDRPAAYAAGGKRQLEALGQPLESFDGYFTDALALDPHDYLLKPLHRGSSVIAGTILGRIGRTDETLAPHVEFSIRPAGRGAPRIDPKPILDGWKLLESTAIYRANGKNAFAAASAAGPSIGQIMLMSKEQLQRIVLADPRLAIYECGRQDILTGQIDRRVLATLAFLSASGLRLSVTALKCGHSYYTTSGNVSEHSSGNAVDIAAVNDIPISGNQGSGSITDLTIRRLLTLQGTMKPHQIISLMTYPGTDNTLALPDHADHIHVGFYPLDAPLGGRPLQAILKPHQWTKLVEQLGSIENPVVPSHVSKYAIKDGRGD